MQHALATQLEERIIQLKDYEILDNTIIFGIATINTVFFIYWMHHPIITMNIIGNAYDTMIIYY